MATELLREESFSANDFSSFTINATSHEVVITSSDSSKLIVRQYGASNTSQDELFISNMSDGILNISFKEPEFPKNLLNISFGKRRMEIELPSSLSGGIVAKTASGRITITGSDLTPDTFLIESASGEITLDATVETNDFVAKAASGQIKLKQAVKSKKLRLESVSGKISAIEEISASSAANIGTTSGSIDLEGIAAQEFDIHSISGNITARSLSGGGKVGTTSGEIRLSSFTITGDTETKSVSGNILLELAPDQSFYFEGSSLSGNIRSRYSSDLSGNIGKNGSIEVGDNPLYKIVAGTTSGNITVN